MVTWCRGTVRTVYLTVKESAPTGAVTLNPKDFKKSSLTFGKDSVDYFQLIEVWRN